MFCCALLYVPSSFAIILMGKIELVALLSLSSWCHVIVVRLFLPLPWSLTILTVFFLQPRNKQVSKEVVQELAFGDIAVMQI